MSECVGSELRGDDVSKHRSPVWFSYKKGGVASGMRHVESNTYDIRRLLHVKGKKQVIGKEVRTG